MEHTWRTLLIILAAVAGFFAILLVAINSSSGGGDLQGDWTVELVVIDGEEFPPLPGTEVTASFDGDDVSGSAGCNSYSGPYETDGDGLTIGPLASTEIFCEDPPGVMDQELGYLVLLGQAESFSVNGDLLSISVGDGRRIALARN